MFVWRDIRRQIHTDISGYVKKIENLKERLYVLTYNSCIQVYVKEDQYLAEEINFYCTHL